MQKNRKKIMALILCLSIVCGVIGTGIVMTNRAKAGTVTSTINLNQAVTINFSDGNDRELKFTPTETALYEFYTYNNKAGDPAMYLVPNADWSKSTEYSNDGLGYQNNEYGATYLSKGTTYSFWLRDTQKKSCSFIIKKVSVTTIEKGNVITADVNSDSGVKWFRAPANSAGYRVFSNAGTVSATDAASKTLTGNAYTTTNSRISVDNNEHCFYLSPKDGSKDMYFYVKKAFGSTVTVALGEHTDATVSAQDNGSALDDKSSSTNVTDKIQNVTGKKATGTTVALKVTGTNAKNFLWYDENGKNLQKSLNATASTYNYSVTGTAGKTVTITCAALDQYCNVYYVKYTITITGSSTPTYKVTFSVKGSNSGISYSGLTSGQSYNGNKTFSVTCSEACRVYYTTNSGGTYTKLSPSGSGNTRSFTVNVNAAMTIVIVKAGDVDMSGTVNADDAMDILKYDVKKVTLTDLQKKIADVTGNNVVNADDAMDILKKDVKKITLSW